MRCDKWKIQAAAAVVKKNHESPWFRQAAAVKLTVKTTYKSDTCIDIFVNWIILCVCVF